MPDNLRVISVRMIKAENRGVATNLVFNHDLIVISLVKGFSKRCSEKVWAFRVKIDEFRAAVNIVSRFVFWKLTERYWCILIYQEPDHTNEMQSLLRPTYK